VSEEEVTVKKNGNSEPLKKAAELKHLWLHLPGLVREALYEVMELQLLAPPAEIALLGLAVMDTGIGTDDIDFPIY